ncbi:MAG: hypothetical protein K1X78_08055 [Verrucomicrobiaceae bacterium]|nr:hypothetical protein [Verrucomicrobiaceae bacterium]
MNRALTWFIGPEALMVAVVAWVCWICRQHPSGEGRDVEVLERVLMVLPLVVVPVVFATVFVPGARCWSWLCRANAALFIGTVIFAYKLVSGFGSGAKGQDVGFFMAVTFVVILSSFGSSVAGAIILAAERPEFARWFHAHKFLGVLATLASALPLGFALAIIVTGVLGIVGGMASALHK